MAELSTLLPHLTILRVTGDDRAEFLHNQLSNDIKNLAENAACIATYNTPKGRVIANILVIARAHDILLILPHDLIETVEKRLKMFVLRSKVVFSVQAALAVAASWVAPPKALPASPVTTLHGYVNDNGVQVAEALDGGLWLVGKTQALPAFSAELENEWQLRQIQTGQAWISAATSETCVAQMLHFHQTGAVHFRKGCYPGQEIIARAQYRGQVKRSLARIESAQALKPGDKLLDSANDEAGLVINTAFTKGETAALAVIKHGALKQDLSSAVGNVVRVTHPFFTPETSQSAT